MASLVLGKRKRPASALTREARGPSADSSDSLHDAQAIFKRHFEAHFKPLRLPEKNPQQAGKAPEPQSGDDIEWDGISEANDDESIEVVEHTIGESPMAIPREELKAFMSSKPPIDTPIAPVQPKTSRSIKEDRAEAENLKKDLALQRLLAESHLLDCSSGPTFSGNNRHKAVDLRLKALGSKSSLFTQEKMPMSHRKGIIAKQTERENQRRREARENGIILEKAKGSAKRQREGKRDRGIGGPSVGKFLGGTLRLSKRDVFNIENPEKTFGRKGVRRGREGKKGIPGA